MKSDSLNTINRRQFLKLSGTSLIGITMAGTALKSVAQDKPKLDENSAAAKAYDYKEVTPDETKNCLNCAFVAGQSGEWLACPLFQQNVVAANGWCKSWVLNPSA